MKFKPDKKLKDGAQCDVVGGTHAGKSGTVKDIHTSKTGAVTLTVLQRQGRLRSGISGHNPRQDERQMFFQVRPSGDWRRNPVADLSSCFLVEDFSVSMPT